MRAMICAAAMMVAMVATATPAQQAAFPSWMAGAWEQKGAGDRWADEFWTPPRGGIMIGAGRVGRGERLSIFEHTRIIRRADGVLVFVAQPKGAPPTEFPLVASDRQMVEFANPAHDYPQRIKYWREGTQLKARTSLMDGSKAQDWVYAAMGAR